MPIDAAAPLSLDALAGLHGAATACEFGPQPRPRVSQASLELPASLRRFYFDSDTLATVVGGKSAIDMPRLRIDSRDEARLFLMSYGFDLSIDTHRSAVERIRADALGFLRGVLLAHVDVEVPDTFDNMDLLELL